MEIIALSLLGILYLLAFIPSSLGKFDYYGAKWVAGNRALKEGQSQFHLLNTWGARGERAYLNLQTNYPPFAVAVICIITLEIQSSLTSQLCLVYLIARILHFLAYIMGIVWPRALFWFTGWLINLFFYGLILKSL